jgi:hypothetical protein
MKGCAVIGFTLCTIKRIHYYVVIVVRGSNRVYLSFLSYIFRRALRLLGQRP